MTFTCRVYGLPVAQGRPRAFKTPAGFIRMYDPETSKDWKRTVQAQVISEWGDRKPMHEAVSMTLVFALPRPKSLPKRVTQHTKRPDLDNLCKAIKDACRGILYDDDSQVVELMAFKGYDERPGVQITVEDRTDADADESGSLLSLLESSIGTSR